ATLGRCSHRSRARAERGQRTRIDARNQQVIPWPHATLPLELGQNLAHQPNLERELDVRAQAALFVSRELCAPAQQISGVALAHAVSSTKSRRRGSARACATNAALALRKRLRTVSSGAPQMAATSLIV